MYGCERFMVALESWKICSCCMVMKSFWLVYGCEKLMVSVRLWKVYGCRIVNCCGFRVVVKERVLIICL